MNNTCETFTPGRLIIILSVAALLGMSLFFPATGDIWRNVSLTFFHMVNDTLLLSDGWAHIIAFTNTEPFNVIGAVGLAFPTLMYLYFSGTQKLDERLARFSLLWLVVITVTIISKHLLPSIDHESPSLVVDSFVNLQKIVPTIGAKISSGHSFPGDHAVTSLTTIGMAFLLLGNRYAVAVTIMAVIYVAPRLFSGAHWLSDVLVGGGMALLISLAIISSLPTLLWMRAVWKKLLRSSLVVKCFKFVRLTH